MHIVLARLDQANTGDNEVNLMMIHYPRRPATQCSAVQYVTSRLLRPLFRRLHCNIGQLLFAKVTSHNLSNKYSENA